MPQVGVIGYGIVGQATASVFQTAAVYDPPKGFHDPACLAGCPVVFLCLPTPTVDGGNDLRAVHSALAAVGPFLSREQVVAVRSTVLPGTVRMLQAQHPGLRFASNPEFLRAHRAYEDAAAPYRVVIGADEAGLAHLVRDAYAEVLPGGTPFVLTDSATAEMLKYAANAYLAMKIAYVHEIWDRCRALDLDYGAVAQGLALDPRIGPGDELRVTPGRLGFDDECLPKDLDAFLSFLDAAGLPSRLLRATTEVNDGLLRRNAERDLVGAGEGE